MNQEIDQPINYGREIVSWKVPAHEKHERERAWYITAGVISLALLVYCFFTSNFLFAVIIILIAIIVVTTDGQDPAMLRFVITNEGIVIGNKFYDYDEIKDFSIVYKPRIGVKNLYFEFNNQFKHRLSIPLDSMNPLPIRENLLKYLTEDLERIDQPTSEVFGKVFKI